MRTRDLLGLALAGLLAVAVPVSAQAPLGTSFTYQGVLTDNGAPLDGLNQADVRATLWDALAGGTQIGSASTEYYVDFDRGRFTVQFDFGASPFASQARYLELAVAVPPGSGFVTLAPRQPVTATPIALHALTSDDSFWDEASGGICYMAGNVGVGTTTPATTLHALSTDANGTAARIEHQGLNLWDLEATGPSSPEGVFKFIIRDGYLNATRLTIDEAGNVGIGTSSPLGKLTISGDEDTDLLSFMAGGADRFSITAHATGPDYLSIRSKFEDPDTDIIVFTGSGSVGIGTIGPVAPLEVNKAHADAAVRVTNADTGLVGYGLKSYGSFGGYFETTLENPYGTNPTAYATVGGWLPPLGESALGCGIDAYGDYTGGHFVGTAYAAIFEGPDNDGIHAPLKVIVGGQEMLIDGNEIDSTVNMYIQDNSDQDIYLATGGGDVGIGTSSTSGFKLAVNGSAAKPGGGSWSVFSDRRLKQCITPLSGVLDRLLDLRGYTFEYTAEALDQRLGLAGCQVGLIAQEVQQVFPEWVDEDADGYLYVTERGTTALMVEALRELRAEKDTELAVQRARIAELEARLAQLEQLLMVASVQPGDSR